jgi:hypothetical protein
MNEWQHYVAIRGIVVAYEQFDVPNEERTHDA